MSNSLTIMIILACHSMMHTEIDISSKGYNRAITLWYMRTISNLTIT